MPSGRQGGPPQLIVTRCVDRPVGSQRTENLAVAHEVYGGDGFHVAVEEDVVPAAVEQPALTPVPVVPIDALGSLDGRAAMAAGGQVVEVHERHRGAAVVGGQLLPDHDLLGRVD